MNAIEIALKMETDAIKFYGDASEKTENAVGKKMFLTIREDEKILSHLKRVNSPIWTDCLFFPSIKRGLRGVFIFNLFDIAFNVFRSLLNTHPCTPLFRGEFLTRPSSF
ncbi:MAG: hypothetical protein HZA14_09580 [Nitrospirae bacterium]|nr:hypothetical protein [Nitrospirota bacterium]